MSEGQRRGLMNPRLCCGLLCAAMIGDAAAAVTADGLRAATEYSAAHKGTRLLVIERGKTVLDTEQNEGGGPMRIYSGTKAFWNLCALAAQEQGVLELDERASDTLAEWRDDKRKSQVTLRELLNFSSGLEAGFSLHNDGWSDRNVCALELPLVGRTGEDFIYGPAGLQVFHEVLKRKLAARKQTPTEFFEVRVLRPMGLRRQRYLEDKAGNPLLGAGFVMSASDWAKMGRLILRSGEPVLRRGMDQAFQGSSANPMFGLGFWTNHLAAVPGAQEVDPEELLHLNWRQQRWKSTCLCHSAPRDLVASIGSGGQRLYVIPSLELIVVRQGFISSFSDGRFLRALLTGE